MAPASRSVEPPCVAPGWDAADLSSLPPAVVETITQSRAPSTRQTYALKRSLFANWYSSHQEDPRRCTIGVVISFLQERLEHRLSPYTLKCPTTMQWTAGPWDSMISSSGSWRVPGGWTPPEYPLCPLGTSLSSWLDFRGAPLSRWTQSSWNSCLLDSAHFHQKLGDLQAFSVSKECLVFGPVYSHVVLRPRPGYVPNVPTTSFCDQVVNLQALPSEEADPALALLCPVRALRIYVDRTRSFRNSEQLFVCRGSQQKGKSVSKQRLAHRIVEAVTLEYQSQGEPCPLGGEGSLHSECCHLPCVGARRLFGRHLQSCGLGDTEHLRKILQSLRWASLFPCIG